MLDEGDVERVWSVGEWDLRGLLLLFLVGDDGGGEEAEGGRVWEEGG